MATARNFNIPRTCNFIREQTTPGSYSSYRQISRHYGFADQDWAYIGPLLIRHLNLCLRQCALHDEPLWPVLVVAHRQRHSGQFSPRRLRQMARALGLPANTAFENYIAAQQAKCFATLSDDAQQRQASPLPTTPQHPAPAPW